jgi:hypothetical protein
MEHQTHSDDDETLIRRVINAIDAPAIEISGPRSVFELAQYSMIQFRITAQAQGPTRPRLARLVERGEGFTRCRLVPYLETREGQERELQRRARQVVPRAGQIAAKRALAHLSLFAGLPGAQEVQA